MTPRHLLEPARLAGSALLRAQSDARLVDLTRAGTDRAFEAIVARHKGDLSRYCSRILPDSRAEDAVQQVFVNAYRALHRDTTPLSLRSWLFGIAHNVSLNLLRQRGGDHEPLEAHPGTAESAHVTHERRERFREVLAAVAALPPGQRDAIVLRELEGRGHEEIARELGVTGGAARQLISRARHGVRQAAAAVVPMPLLMRVTGGSAPSPTAERIAELTAVGGGVTVAKVVATGAIGATLLGGAVTGPGLIEGNRDRRSLDVAEAAPAEQDDGANDDETGNVPTARQDGPEARRRGAGSSGPDDGDGDRSGSNSGPGSGERDDDDDDEDDDRDEDDSGPGPGDDDDEDDDVERDSSGPGDGGDDEPDSSGPGSGDDDEPDDEENSGSDEAGLEEEDDEPDEEDHSGSDDESDDEESSDSSGPSSDDPDEDEILEPDDDNSGPGSGTD